MKKIIPFKKDIKFKNHLYEVTSISLEHTLHIEEQEIVGEFIVSGDYRVTENSNTTEDFVFNIPFSIDMDSRYNLNKALIDINDFYYEIVNDDILLVSIEVKIDKIEEVLLDIVSEDRVKDISNETVKENNTIVENCEREEIMPIKTYEEDTYMINKLEESIPIEDGIEPVLPVRDVDAADEVKSLFANFDDSNEIYATYKVCIIRENDTVDSIIAKYNTTREDLEQYNDLRELKIGDKLIVPNAKD